MRRILDEYNALRRKLVPASKNDLDWRSNEIRAHLSRIEQKLATPPIEPPPPPPPAKPERYSLAATKNGYMLTFSDDMVIGRSLRDLGHFQEEDIRKAVSLLEQKNYMVKRDVFLDIGANIGTHTVYALQHGFQRAMCVEADPENFRLLKINQILNGVDASCVNICAAASLDAGEADIELSPTNYGDHRVAVGEGQKSVHGESFWDRQRIRTETIDRMIENANLSLDEIGFAWIDTQGHEGHVLAGGKAFLAASIPFVAEFWPYGLGRSGGWGLLRDALVSSQREIYDLRRSIEEGRLAETRIEELDQLYESWLKEESRQSSPHTDLLVTGKPPG